MEKAYTTKLGTFYKGKVEEIFENESFDQYKKNINLILTSPPFPLNTKKKYGNLQGDEYVKWLTDLAPLLKEYLADDGSIVIELGNSWEPKRPVMSSLSLKALLAFLESGNFSLCQQFVWYNPAKLPSPAQWVNIERIRVKDAFTNIWWMATTDFPKACNRNVLTEYSDKMKDLLKKKKYNYGKRPSEHNIGETSFLTDNSGAIPSNVISVANTHSRTKYQEFCKEKNLRPHPARMPVDIPKFFINFLTDPGDLIFDPFGGSNTTGATAEEMGRSWISIEPKDEYILGSIGRFNKSDIIESPIG
jgi:site-specific DNA-methyltransferase (cytosine-N4-specific)